MKTELEKCMAGELYNCHDKVFLEFKSRTRKLLTRYNSLEFEQKAEKTVLLRELLGRMGANVSVGQPFLCDYGINICLGDNVSINMNCTGCVHLLLWDRWMHRKLLDMEIMHLKHTIYNKLVYWINRDHIMVKDQMLLQVRNCL